MDMENIRASVTPLTVNYSSNKPYSLVLKLKRIMIKTDYEVEKFQCKKQFTLKNGAADMSGFPTQCTYSFKLSKEFEIDNTKVDFMIFGALNKQVKLLGIATLDLGKFQHAQLKDFPIDRNLKLDIGKSEDRNAYLMVRLVLEYLPAQPKNNKNSKDKYDGTNSLKTESYNRQSLIIARRKHYDMPSAYEISKRNYKQAQVVRTGEDRSKSNPRKQSGSYKKRFQYQYSRSVVMKPDQDELQEPQAPPTKLPQNRGSPVPRMRTPEPVTNFRSSPTVKDQTTTVRNQFRKNNQNQNQEGYSKVTKNRIKIMVDVYKQHRVIEEIGNFENQLGIQRQREEKYNKFQDQKQRMHEGLPKKTENYGRIQKNKVQNYVGRISQQHIPSPSHVQQPNKYQQKPQISNYETKKPAQRPIIPVQKPKQVNQIQNPKQQSKNYEKYRQQQTKIQQSIKKSSKDEKKMEKNQENKPQIIKASTKQLKQRDSSQNKYKMITDKLQMIENKIREGKKSQSSVSPPLNKETASPKSQNLSNQSEDQTQHRKQDQTFPEKRTKQTRQQKPFDKNTKIGNQNISVNTFKQESQHEYSPEKQPNTTGRHINSFNHMTQSNKGNQQSMNPLDSIAEETGNMSRSGTNFKGQKKQEEKKIPSNKEDSNVYQSSVANFSVTDRDDPVNESDKVIDKPQNSQKNQLQIKKPQIVSGQKIEKRPKKFQGKVIPLFELTVQPQKRIENQIREEPKKIIESEPQNKQNPILNHKGCQQKITYLQNLLDQQQQTHRKELMEKQLQCRNDIKAEMTKSQNNKQELAQLREENNRLRQNQKINESKNKGQIKDSKESASSNQEVAKLKEENIKLRNLLDKLNLQLEQTDEKHFQALTAAQKKDLQHQRKIDGFIKKNAELTEKLQAKEAQLRDLLDKGQKLKSVQTMPGQPIQSIVNEPKSAVSEKQIPTSANNTKNYQQQLLAQRKKCVNLQGQLRQKTNQLKFLKIKNDNLLQQKKDLQNQIDNIAINNKLQMAKQGSISKLNLEAASVTNSVRVENKALKEEINSLRRQVHQLNGMLEGIITQGALEEERVSSSREVSNKQNGENMDRKYKALEKKAQAYEQEIKAKQMKIAEIINAIFSHGNPQLMDQVSKLVGMSQAS